MYLKTCFLLINVTGGSNWYFHFGADKEGRGSKPIEVEYMNGGLMAFGWQGDQINSGC